MTPWKFFCNDENSYEKIEIIEDENENEVLVLSDKDENSVELEPNKQKRSCGAWLPFFLGWVGASSVLVFFTFLRNRPHSIWKKIGNIKNKNEMLDFICPARIQVPKNFHNDSFTEEYIGVDDGILTDFTNFSQTYQDLEFDGWGVSYRDVKRELYDWKTRRFVSNLNDGDKIYESACGIGLSLLMTLEIAFEVKGIRNLEVYGNEYLRESASIANHIMDTVAPSLQAKKGIICTADSTDLQFVPENAFDLVFTGYISTLLDPLEFNVDLNDVYDKYYLRLCRRAKAGKDWEAFKLNEISQQRQNDWFGLWISEMVRLARPGAPLIFEEVSYPICDFHLDWGGVSKKFWVDGINYYNWDVDPASIEFENSTVFSYRYHVFMRKSK